MAKIQVTAQQRANAIEARDVVWPSVPKKNVARGLGAFTVGEHSRTDCGTVACGGGWICRWPAFRAQGAGVDAEGIPTWNGETYVGGLARGLFGVSTWLLFDARRDNERGTDHEVFARRLRVLIKNSVVV